MGERRYRSFKLYGGTTYGVSIEDVGNPLYVPRIRNKHIVVCPRNVSLSLKTLSTLYFSGDWILQLDLDIFAFTAIIPIKESYFWLSTPGGRHHGLVQATAIGLAVWKLEGEAMKTSMIACLRLMRSRLILFIRFLDDSDRHGQDLRVQFAAQTDDWEMEWRKRSRVLLARLKDQWTKYSTA